MFARLSEVTADLGISIDRPVITWDPFIGKFIEEGPDVRGGFLKASDDPKFAGRRVLTNDQLDAMMANLSQSHIVVPFAISGDNLSLRHTQLLDLLGLIRQKAGDSCVIDVILLKPYGDRNDTDHKRDDRQIHNAKTIDTMSRLLKHGLGVNRVYHVEPHSFQAMRLVTKQMNSHAVFLSLARPLSKKALEYLTQNGLGHDFSMEDVVVCAPDGGMKHLEGSARYLAYLKAHGHNVPAPKRYATEPLKLVYQAWEEALEKYRADTSLPFDYDTDKGPQASIQRAWLEYLFLKGLDTNMPVPLLPDDFPPDFLVFDKVRKDDSSLESLNLILGDPSGKIVISVDDVSSTGGTQITCAQQAYMAGARSFIPILMHGGFVHFKEGVADKNGLLRMLLAKNPKDSGDYLFPVIMTSNTAPSAEEFKVRFLPDHPEMHSRVMIFDVADVTLDAAVSAILHHEYGIENPRLATMVLPEVQIAEQYGLLPKPVSGHIAPEDAALL